MIAQELSDQEQQTLELVLKDLVEDSGNRSITMAKADGKTIVTVAPVADVTELAKKLTVAKELEVDAEKGVISVQKIELK